jgi:hypothetical protein
MPAIRMVGNQELSAALLRVGKIVDAASRLEEAASYLQWQLTAFAWVKDNPQATRDDRQVALRTERARWDKYMQLNERLRLVTKAFDAPQLMNVMSADRKLEALRSNWNKLSERTRKLGEKRNLVGHSSMSWSNGKVLREIGRPWSQKDRGDREGGQRTDFRHRNP